MTGRAQDAIYIVGYGERVELDPELPVGQAVSVAFAEIKQAHIAWLAQTVKAYQREHPDASANEVVRALGHRRDRTLAAYKLATQQEAISAPEQLRATDTPKSRGRRLLPGSHSKAGTQNSGVADRADGKEAA
ncbi:MAG TPA: hypothetical protein VIM33_01645 [Gaiellaceae bacterium]